MPKVLETHDVPKHLYPEPELLIDLIEHGNHSNQPGLTPERPPDTPTK